MKRISLFCLSAALVLCVTLLPTTAHAADEVGSEAITDETPPSEDTVVEEGADAGMFASTAQLGKIFMSGIWRLFDIYVPGFSFTFGQMWLGVALCSISLLVLKMLFGIGGRSSGESSRTSSTNDPKISEERRYDEF